MATAGLQPQPASGPIEPWRLAAFDRALAEGGLDLIVRLAADPQALAEFVAGQEGAPRSDG